MISVYRFDRTPGVWICLFAAVFAVSGSAFAAGEGQEDLDKATLTKLRAQSMEDLEKTVDLCESALQKGLDDESATYARQLLTATLHEHATRISRLVLDQPRPNPRWPALRRLAMKDLEMALEYDASLGGVHLLIARLQMLPRGNVDLARESIEKAIELLPEDGPQKAMAYLVRGTLNANPEQAAGDFEKAIALNPRNADAWRALAVNHLQAGNVDKSLESFEKLLELKPDDLLGHQALAEILTQQKKYDEALVHLDKAIAGGSKSPMTHVLRAEILAASGKVREAIKSLRTAQNLNPADARIALVLARSLIQVGDLDLALEQVNRILQGSASTEESDQARILRSVIFASQSNFDQAASDIDRVLNRRTADSPDRINLLLQLATYYVGGKRPSLAITALTEIVELDPNQWQALRMRGDALLSLGQHAEAIADYETALAIQPDDSGILNNLAWVLATSPVDDIRNGERAIELAKHACDVTEYKAAHILSTLAAGYAEAGNFDEAVKWSSKATVLDPDEEQLANELKNYEQRKPWRELQQMKEKPLPNEPSESDLIFELAD